MDFLTHSDSVLINFVIMPLLIFLARILDVSAGTIRVIFVARDQRILAPLLGFFESLIWLVAASQILQNLSHPINYIAYAAGFAAGNWVGMIFEGKLAIGKVALRVITRTDASELVTSLRGKNYGVTSVDAEGRDGPVKIIFMLLSRHQLPGIIKIVKTHNPHAFYSIEDLRYVAHGVIPRREMPINAPRLRDLKRLKKHK